MKRILILGDRPGPNTDPKRPLFPHNSIGAAARLTQVMGISIPLYLEVTARANVWHNGEELRNLDQARGFVRRQLNHCLSSGNRPLVIAVGLESLRAFPKPYVGMKFGETRQDEEMGFHAPTVLYLPHTSGKSRVWNDHAFKEKLTRETTELVKKYINNPRPSL